MAFERIMKGLVEQELILPYFELSMISENWPDHYTVEVDSSPYYGAGDGYFHPSTHPLMGLRQLYYRFHPATRGKMVPERSTLRKQMILSMGSAMHAVVQTQMQMVGLVKSADNVEVEFVIDEHHVRGRIDFIVDHPNGNQYIVEMKTMDPYLYRRLETIKPEWDAQLSLQEYALGKTQGIVLAMERGGDCQMREFFHHRNDVLLDQIFEKFAYIRECIESNTPPRHCCVVDSQEMQECPARYECWLKDGG
jgi:hypothetical protein